MSTLPIRFAKVGYYTDAQSLSTPDGSPYFQLSQSIVLSDRKFDTSGIEGWIPAGDWRDAREVFEDLGIPPELLQRSQD